jgi:hypothetical protein
MVLNRGGKTKIGFKVQTSQRSSFCSEKCSAKGLSFPGWAEQKGKKKKETSAKLELTSRGMV